MADTSCCPSSACFCYSVSSTDSDRDVYQRNQMFLPLEHRREKKGSCFSRAARSIRRALSRICRVTQSSSSDHKDYEDNEDNEDNEDYKDYEDYEDYEDYTNNRRCCYYQQLPTNQYNYYEFLSPRERKRRYPVDMCYPKKRFRDSNVKAKETELQEDTLGFREVSVRAVTHSATNPMPTHSEIQFSNIDMKTSKTLQKFHSLTLLSQTTCAENKTRSNSLPDMKLNTSFQEFTPVFTADEDDETYRFQCSSPGLYLCSVTGLMFDMKGEGDVVYRIVPWNRRLLVQHHKKPAGPLFDIKCVQQCVSQLHLPHCEISSTGGGRFLSVAHVSDDGDVEFIRPQKITETHVVINITGFSAYGNVKDGDSPPDPVRALVLLFYKPPADLDPESQINVLLLPKNVCLHDVQRTRKKLVGDEMYIETSPHCKLKPDQVYTLSTCPQDDSVLVQPTEAEFDEDSYNNYFPSFQVDLEEVLKHIKLILRDTNSSDSVWERRVCLLSTGKRKSCEQRALNLPPNKRLLDVRSSFIGRISEPVLKSLLDKLLEKKVLSDSERESVNVEKTRGDRARVVIDTVRRKGEAACTEMIEFLCELDPFLCEHLDLI